MNEHNEYDELANMADWGNKMKDQRDELLVACEKACASLGGPDEVRWSPISTAWWELRHAIAKVKGESDA